MSLFDQINADIKSAMLAKEKAKLEPLRSVKAAFIMAKTEKGATGELTAEAEIKIIQKLVKQRKDSAQLYIDNNRQELADKELYEATVIEQYLPVQLSEEEVLAGVKEIVVKIGASGPQDMGKVMGMASKHFSGKAEGKVISAIVKQVLASL
ncbi:MAG: GatB/YqeY domain-containing protein [Salinivirgaceae bacterium]|nr:GatB/YqeY domain-containing protein [Salinivirgaceae bacterium]